MDSETKQELLTVALLMKKARMQEEVDGKEALDKMEEENYFVNEEEQRLEMQDEADRLVRQQLSFGFSKFEDMVRHVAMKQPDEYKRLKPLLRKTWNFWCRDPEEEIACERGKEICFKIEEEIEKSALEQRQKKYDMTTQRGRLLAAIEGCIVNTEEFGTSEELLLAAWLLCNEDLNLPIGYNHLQTRKAIRFTFDRERFFINGILWDYDIDNDHLGEVHVTILGHDFMHQAVWERYSDTWFDNHWINMESHGEVCKELDEVLNVQVHCGGCDDLVFEEEPFVDNFIIASALANTKRCNHCFYLLVDRDNRVYMAYDKKHDEEGEECWQLINGWSETIALIPIGQLRVINEEEFVQLLLQQELIISDGFGDAEDELWSPNEKRLFPMVEKGAMK